MRAAAKSFPDWFTRTRTRLATLFVGVMTLAVLAAFSVIFALAVHIVHSQIHNELRRNLALFTACYTEPLDGRAPDRVTFMQREFDEESRETGMDKLYCALFSAGRRRLASSPMSGDLFRQLAALAPGKALTVRTLSNRGRPAKARVRLAELDDGALLAVGVNCTKEHAGLVRLAAAMGGAAVTTILFSALAAFFFAPAVLRAAETSMAALERTAHAIAHDLKTPLTRLRGTAERAATAPELLPELAGNVAEECDAMVNFINAALAVAAAGHARRGDGTGDLAAAARKSVDVLRPLAEEKGITLETRLPPGPVAVALNTVDLERLTGNLIDNAIKYTPEGGTVTVALAADSRAVELTVADSGPGVAPEDKPRIFEQFYRASASRSQPGNGLGLSLVAALAAAAGGKVTVADAKPSGAVFTVRLTPPSPSRARSPSRRRPSNR